MSSDREPIAHNGCVHAHADVRGHLMRLCCALIAALAAFGACACCAVAGVPSGRGTVASIVQTTWNLKDALTRQPSRPFTSAPAAGAQIIRVSDNIREQTVSGFGGTMTDSAAWLIEDELGSAQRRAAIADLFSSSGLDLNEVRIPMGASDFTVDGTPYSYDDMPAGRSDPTLAHFSIAHDDAYILPALRAMLREHPGVETFANPWSAPPWMKANDAFDDIGSLGWVYPSDYQALADYFVKFIDAYQAAGVPIDALTPMNEPTSGAKFPATYFITSESPFVVNYLKPALAAAGLSPLIYGLDDSSFDGAYDLMSTPVASQLNGTAFHCYTGMGYFTTFHEDFPGAQIILNECAPGIIPYPASEVVIDAADNWVSSVKLWTLAADTHGGPVQPPNSGCTGCVGLLTVSERSHTFIRNRSFYQFGQATRYIEPGAVHIQSTRLVSDLPVCDGHGVSAGVDDAAFLNPDGTTVVLAYNNSAAASTIALAWHGSYLSWRLAAKATVTFTWR